MAFVPNPERCVHTGTAMVILKSHDNPCSSSDTVLRSLGDCRLDPVQRRRLVIEAEALDLTIDQAAMLTPLLQQFIDDHRDSNDPADLVAVGSAIRTFIAIATPDDAFAYAASLLKAGGRSPLPIELELELAKMVVRKLTARTPETDDPFPELADRLRELVETYLNPRLLGREKHGAVALNAVLGLLLARSRHVPKIIGKVRGLGVPWFEQQVARRAERLKAEIEGRDSTARFGEITRSLADLSVALPA